MKDELHTIGQIADLYREPPSRISYIVSKYRLKPVKRVGIIRLFGPEQLKAIKDGLYTIQVRCS
ncbi:MAG: hypothetical protein GY774_10015 [Planctomycetes bacterium]|nr:hypothetical protein [Planctomycetota bacterium]